MVCLISRRSVAKLRHKTMEVVMNIGTVDGTAAERGVTTHERLWMLIETIQPGLRKFMTGCAQSDDYRHVLKVMPISVQIEAYKVLYPELGDNPSVGQTNGDLSYGAEGRFLVPNIWKTPSPLDGGYGQLVVRVSNMFSDYSIKCPDDFNPDMIRQTSSARNVMENLSKEQDFPDLLVFDVQLGMLYKDLSPIHALANMFAQQQFPIGLFAGLNILLLHPVRLMRGRGLGMIFLGDEYVTMENASYRNTFVLKLDRRLHIGSVSYPFRSQGILSGFIPKWKP